MTTVTIKQATEYEVHKFVADASDLGIAPGRFPSKLDTDLGNKMPFLFRFFDEQNAAHYQQANGCISLQVLND